MSHRDKKLVYHLTAVSNLESVRKHGLLSRRELRAKEILFTDVADDEILSLRQPFELDGMVPFHFFSKNPFDYAVTRTRPKDRFVLISVYRSFAAQNSWKIIARHPLSDSESPELLTWNDGLDKIDWHQMDRPDRNYDLDHNCKMVCMAEALSPSAVQLDQVARIYAPSDATKAIVQLALGMSNIEIATNAKMFPTGCP